jgi:hypothetical protein
LKKDWGTSFGFKLPATDRSPHGKSIEEIPLSLTEARRAVFAPCHLLVKAFSHRQKLRGLLSPWGLICKTVVRINGTFFGYFFFAVEKKV